MSSLVWLKGRKTLWWQMAAFLPLLVCAALVHVFGRAGVPVHWGMNGQADGWSGGFWSDYGGPLLGGIMLIVLLGARWGLRFVDVEKRDVLRVMCAGLAWVMAAILCLPAVMLLCGQPESRFFFVR